MPQNPTLEEWRLLTLRLRIAGWSYREIATRVGVSPTQVFRDIGRVCDRLRKDQYGAAQQQVELQDRKPPEITVHFGGPPGRAEEDAHGA